MSYFINWNPQGGSSGSGDGDMLKSDYDKNNNLIVDKSESLEDGSTSKTVTAGEVVEVKDKYDTILQFFEEDEASGTLKYKEKPLSDGSDIEWEEF